MQTVMIKVSNRGSQDVESIRLSVIQNGTEKPVSTFDLQADQSVVDTFNLRIDKTDWNELTVKITDFPIQFDDVYHLAFKIPGEPSNVGSEPRSRR